VNEKLIHSALLWHQCAAAESSASPGPHFCDVTGSSLEGGSGSNLARTRIGSYSCSGHTIGVARVAVEGWESLINLYSHAEAFRRLDCALDGDRPRHIAIGRACVKKPQSVGTQVNSFRSISYADGMANQSSRIWQLPGQRPQESGSPNSRLFGLVAPAPCASHFRAGPVAPLNSQAQR